jgi:GLPGLI family protein
MLNASLKNRPQVIFQNFVLLLMKMKYLPGISTIIWFLTVILLPVGCSQSRFQGKEGRIVYDVSFETENMNPLVKAMLPTEVNTYFKDGITCTVISMGMNVMETRLISDSKNFTYTTLVKGMGRKVAMVLDKNKVKEHFKDHMDLKVMHTGEIKEIAGLKCTKAMITDSTDNTYPVYYTNDLPVEDPNWSTPYHGIDGILMEYSINFGNMVMTLKAKKIEHTEVVKEMFTIPDDYELIENPGDLDFTI